MTQGREERIEVKGVRAKSSTVEARKNTSTKQKAISRRTQKVEVRIMAEGLAKIHTTLGCRDPSTKLLLGIYMNTAAPQTPENAQQQAEIEMSLKWVRKELKSV